MSGDCHDGKDSATSAAPRDIVPICSKYSKAPAGTNNTNNAISIPPGGPRPSSHTVVDVTSDSEGGSDHSRSETDSIVDDDDGRGICKKNGIPHSLLTKFGITTCPACGEFLNRDFCPVLRMYAHKGLRVFGIRFCPKCLSDLKAAKEDEKPGTSHAVLGQPEDSDGQVAHFVQCLDKDDRAMATTSWPRPFDLDEEIQLRRRRSATHRKSCRIKLTTVLGTSCASEHTRVGPAQMPGAMPPFPPGGPVGRVVTISPKLVDILHDPSVVIELRMVKLEIQSDSFMRTLRSVLTYDVEDYDLQDDKIELIEPFVPVAHHLTELEDHKLHLYGLISDLERTDEPGPELDEKVAALADLTFVLDYVHGAIDGHVAKEQDLHNRDKPLCTFRMLWLLFRPGSMVYVVEGGFMDAYVVESTDHGNGVLSGPLEKLVAFNLDVWYLDFDYRTQSLARFLKAVTIAPFVGERPITELNVVPCAVWDKHDGGRTRESLLSEGANLLSTHLDHQVRYTGPFMGIHGRSERSFDGRAFIDPLSWHEIRLKSCHRQGNFVPVQASPAGRKAAQGKRPAPFPPGRPLGGPPPVGPICICELCQRPEKKMVEGDWPVANNPWNGFQDINLSELAELHSRIGTDLTRHHLLVTKKVKGFVFKNRTWETLRVAFCHRPKPNKNPFDRLVMPKERKTLIKSLVNKYTDRTAKVWTADFVRDKGEGQIFLLHGAPGVGKTLTAECIAEYTGNPLLALTCGDIGTDEVEMEDKLGQWLKLGHRWGAVVLLDEAEIFLERRVAADIHRNSLVSVFLREIEYYRGILFLTSNRVGQFDDAFRSRIHSVIHYDDLSSDYCEKIWNLFFDKLEDEKPEIEICRDARRYVLNSKDIASVKWNGREIRNAFQTAVALAEYRFATEPDGDERPQLREEDFKQVCDMTKAFKEYLDQTHGSDETQRAVAHGDRRGEA